MVIDVQDLNEFLRLIEDLERHVLGLRQTGGPFEAFEGPDKGGFYLQIVAGVSMLQAPVNDDMNASLPMPLFLDFVQAINDGVLFHA